MSSAQRYRCQTCGDEKVVPEHPTTGAQSINTGCQSCGRITTHLAVAREREVYRIRRRDRDRDSKHPVVQP